jgi:hypothetical protein
MDPVARLLDTAFLPANREGRLASRQESRLGDGAYRSRFERVMGSLAAVGVAIAAAASTANLQTEVPAERITVWIVAAAIVVLAATVFRPWADPLGADVRAGRVERISGRAVCRAAIGGLGHSPWRPRYEVTIGGLRFPVPSWLWSAVDGDRPITAYYLPRSMTLVSIEAADDLAASPFLPVTSRRTPLAGQPMIVAYCGGVGIALLVRAVLPPVEVLPEIPAGLLFLGIAAVIRLRGASRP